MLVSLTWRVHLFPFRTQKLSSSVVTILGWRRPGKITRCQLYYADLAHLVERDLAKVEVAGSSPVIRSRMGKLVSSLPISMAT